jgi:hypothetical protein
MTAPPGSAPTTEVVAPERDREAGYCLTRTQRDAAVHLLREELPHLTGAQAWSLIRAYLLDQRDAEAGAVARVTFGEWFGVRRRARLRASDPRRDGWRQR